MALVPELRDITAAITCRIEGDNQGVERLGQLRLLEILLRGLREGSKLGASIPACGWGRFIDLDNAVLLVVVHRGRYTGRLLTNAEKKAFGWIISRGAPGKNLFDRDSFRVLWEEVTAAHAWVPAKHILPARHYASSETAVCLHVPAHVVGRVFSGLTDEAGLVTASAVHHRTVAMPKAMAPLLRWLAERPRMNEDVRGALASARSDGWAHLDRMMINGLLDATT